MKHKKLIYLNLIALIVLSFVVFIGLKQHDRKITNDESIETQSLNKERNPSKLILTAKDGKGSYEYDFFRT